MVDWSTVVIAAISAGAGLAGSIIAGHFNLKGLGMSHRRDDDAMIRTKAEDLYVELDRLQEVNNVVTIRAMAAMNSKSAPEPFPVINLGKARALVGLYFPECLPALEKYDTEGHERAKSLRDDLKEQKMDVSTAMLSYALLDSQGMLQMCRDAQTLLDKQVGLIGKSARDSFIAK